VNGPFFSIRDAGSLAADLAVAAALLVRRGLDCPELRVEADGRLRMDIERSKEETACVVLEDADDTAPAGPALGIGPRRLVLLSPDMYADQAQDLLRTVKDPLDEAVSGPLARWMSPPAEGDDRVPRSGGGLAMALAGRIALGATVWEGWRPDHFRWIEDDEFRGVEMAFSEQAGGAVSYLLVEEAPPSGGVEITRTPLGPLLRRSAADGAAERHQLDDPLGFIFGRAMARGVRWADVADDVDEAAEVLRRRKQSTGLIGNCNRGGADDPGEPRSRFFDVWGTGDALGNSAGVAVRRDRVLLMHASRECALATNTLSGDLAVGMRPWGSELVDMSEAPENYLVTDVDDAALVMGGEARYQEALRSGLAVGDDVEVLVFQGCDYHMIGDDVRGACLRCAAGERERVRFMQPEIPQFKEMDSRSWWRGFLDECTARSTTRSADPRVNLVGYGPPDGDGVRAASGLLEKAGISVAATALPFISEEATARWGEAWITLASPWLPVDEVFTDHLRKLELPHASPPLPYGVEGARAWLHEVTEALGIPPVDEERYEALLAEQAPRLGALRREARRSGGRIGFVFDSGSLEEALAPQFFFGTSPLDALGSLGFDLSFVFAPAQDIHARAPGDAALSRLAALGATYEAWEPGSDVDAVLAHYSFDLVYCDALDSRFLRRAGAIPFDIRELRMGPGGAAVNAERLLAGRRLTLYRHHGRHLRHLGSL